MANCSAVNLSTLPKLVEIINLVLEWKRSRSKPFQDAYTLDAHSFLQNTHTLRKKSLSLVNECLLSQRFEEAAKLLWIMCQDRSCFDVALYRGIMVVLENLMPSDVNEIVEKLSSAAKHLKYSNKWDVQLEYLIYAIKNDIHDLDNSSKFLDKHGKGNHRPNPLLHQIYSAYCTLLNYRKWLHITSGDSLSSNDKDFAFSVINSFKKLIDQPGIWDIFVLKLIEMLEYYEEFEEAEEILKKYVECNPEHVNAYIYLCVHLHRYKPDSDIFIDNAKILANLSPSDERVLLLVQTWEKLGKKLKKRLKILFYFLDYPTNRRNILGWKMLSSNLHEAAFGKGSCTLDINKSFWRLRCHSWNNVHFVSSNINTGDETLKLLLHKVEVLSILEPNHEFIQKAELRFPDITELKFTNIERTGSNFEDFKSLYHLDR